MATTRRKRLKEPREKKGFRSARAALLAFRFPVSTYGAHERAELRGGRDYGPDKAKLYAKLFEVAPEWLLMGYAAQGERRLTS